MQNTHVINPNEVGAAFLQQLGASYLLPTKSKRRTEFNRLVRALRNLRLMHSTFHPTHIAMGVDNNGQPAVLVTGEFKNK